MCTQTPQPGSSCFFQKQGSENVQRGENQEGKAEHRVRGPMTAGGLVLHLTQACAETHMTWGISCCILGFFSFQCRELSTIPVSRGVKLSDNEHQMQAPRSSGAPWDWRWAWGPHSLVSSFHGAPGTLPFADSEQRGRMGLYPALLRESNAPLHF